MPITRPAPSSGLFSGPLLCPRPLPPRVFLQDCRFRHSERGAEGPVEVLEFVWTRASCAEIRYRFRLRLHAGSIIPLGVASANRANRVFTSLRLTLRVV